MPIRLDELPSDITTSPLPSKQTQAVSVRLDELDSMAGERVAREDFDLSKIGFSEEESNAIKMKGKIGYFEQAIRMKKFEKVPILGLPSVIYEAAAVRRAIGRLQKDEYGDNKELKQRDFDTANKAIRYHAEEQLRGFTWGGAVIEGASQLPAYMIEFALSTLVGQPGSAAVARGATAAAVKAGLKGTLKTAVTRTASIGTQAAIGSATVFAPRVAEKAYQNEIRLNLTPTEKGLKLNEDAQSKPFSSFVKALGDTYIELFSERTGAAFLDPALKKMAGQKILKPVGDKMIALYKKLHPNDAIGKLFTTAGWDGFVSELGEEILGDQLRAVFNVEDFGSDGNTLDRMLAAIPDGDELAVMMGILAVPGATHVALQQGVGALDNYRKAKTDAGQVVKQPKTLAQEIKQQDFDPVDSIIAEATAPLPQAELSKEEIEELRVKQRDGGIAFETSKPIPDRKLIDEIVSTQDFKEADVERKMELLIRGRTADLDRQRIEIERRMTALEADVSSLSKSTEKTSQAVVQKKEAELELLSKQLLSIHAQISDVVDSTAEELSREEILLPGDTLTSLQKQARKVGARIERSRVETVFRNEKAQAEERRTALVKYLQARLPGPENAKIREKFTLRAAKDMTEKKLQKLFSEIEELRDSVRAKQLRERAEKILEKMTSKVVDGVKRGVFANAGIQSLADELVRVAKLSAPEAEAELQRVHAEVVGLLEAGAEGTEAVEDLKYKASLLSNVGGLEVRNADQLENAIQFLSKKLAEFQTGRDMVREIRKAQWKAEEAQAVSKIRNSQWKPKNPITRAVGLIGGQLNKLFHFSAFNLEAFWRDLGLIKMVADPLFKVSEYTSALQQKMDRPVRQALFDIYGVSKTSTKDFMRFLVDRMSLESDDPNTKPYIKKAVLNNGQTKDFKLSRLNVMYWYASAYQEEGVPDPEAYETLTGENELQAIEEQVELEMAEAEDIEKENAVAQRAANIKGNAIPAEVLESMFAELTPQDKQFALAMRKIFTSFWPLINPVYSRATGVNLTQIESYIPRIKKTASVKTVEDMFTQYAMVEAHVTPFPGSVKERRATSTAPFAEIGLMDVFMGFRDTMSHWIATHDITARQQRYLRNRAIRDSINQATDGVQNKTTGEWRDGMFVKLMDFHLKGLASRGRTDQGIRIPFMDLLRRNISRYYLATFKQFPLQITSAFVALNQVGFVDFVKGVSSFMRDPKGANEVLGKALSMHNRYQNIMIELKEIQDLIQMQKTRPIDKLNFFDKYAYMFLKAGDRGGVLIGGWVIFKAEYEKTKDLKKAYTAFDSYVVNTQQSALREQQTAATVGYGRYFFQFVSAVGQYARLYHRAWANLLKEQSPENIKQWARTMVVFHGLIPLARWAIAQIGLPPDEDEEEMSERQKKQLLAYSFTGPFSGLWLLGDMANLAAYLTTGEKGFDTGPAVISQLNKTRNTLGSAIRKAMEDDSDPDEVLQSMLKAGKETAGLTMGVPGPVSDITRMLFQQASGFDTDGHLLTPEDYFGVLYGQSIDMINYSRGQQ